MKTIPLLLSVLLLGGSAHSATWTVTSTSDSGPGSLRQAMTDAETAPLPPHLIQFNIPGAGPHLIEPLTQLPANTQPVVIDGYTQPGASPNTLSNGFNAVIKISVVGTLNGGSPSTAFRLQNGTTLRGLAIVMQAQKTGVEFAPAGGANIVAGCLIGVKPDGSSNGSGPAQRPSIGIHVRNSSGNQIGGSLPADRNVISHNFSHGVFIEGISASNNVVRGNFIGTDLNGTAIRANFGSGVEVQDAPGNVIGGVDPGARNLISGNQNGVRIRGFGGALRNIIQGNLIGTSVTGIAALANSTDGLVMDNAQETMVGGPMAGAQNVISGNAGFGINISTTTSTGSIIQGNLIGTGVTGAALPNGGGFSTAGIAVAGSATLIGGVLPGEANVIAFNRGSGVIIYAGAQNQIRGNSIHSNQATFPPWPGIDLGNDKITDNDVDDEDVGPNHRQNFPLLTSAAGDGATTTIQGTLNSVADQTYQLDFYGNTACDPSGNGEGQFYLGSGVVLTDGSGNGAFTAKLSRASPGQFITATATDPFGNTSEFSPCLQATIAVPPMTFAVLNTNDAGAGSLRQAILDSNAHLSSENNRIVFNISGTGLQTIQLLSPLPAFIRPVTLDGFTQPGASENTLANGNNANWLIELRGVGSSAGERLLQLNLAGLVVRGLRLTGSAGKGIEMVSSNCVVTGCFIYTNSGGGIYLNAANGNRIGGAAPADRNVISGNNGSVGVDVFLGNANQVLGNFIGTDASGTAALGRQFKGVDLTAESSGNQIGGIAPGAANRIAFHESAGVSIQGGTNNPVRGNQLYANGGPGIDLWSSGVTPNDVGDADDGPNDIQNFPILTEATANQGSTAIQGSLNSRPNTRFDLDFYSSSVCNSSSGRQGETYLGSASVLTDGNGDVPFNVSIPATASGRFLTATATDPQGNTSEFSPCLEPEFRLPPATFLVTNAQDSGTGSLRQAILDVGMTPNVGVDSIHFAIPGAGPHRIDLLTPLPSPSQPVIIDGYQQAGASANSANTNNNAVLKIQLDGSLMAGASPALMLTHGSNVIRGLSFTRFPTVPIRLAGHSNVVEGNWFGVDPSGLKAGNRDAALLLRNGGGHRIGGSTPAARNVISATAGSGILIGLGASNNVISGNFIGLAPDGRSDYGNTEDGVRIVGASWNTVGGPTFAEGNYIVFNDGNGVAVESGGRQNGIFNNLITASGEKNIYIAPGANDGIQPPVLTRAYTGSTIVEGFFQGEPNTTYKVESVASVLPPNAPPDAADIIVLGSFLVKTDAQGRGTVHHEFPHALPYFANIRTTITIANNTSEQSNAVLIIPGESADLQVAFQAPGSVTVGESFDLIMRVVNAGPATAEGVSFALGAAPLLDLLGAELSGGVCTVEGGTVNCSLAQLADGATATVTIRAQATSDGMASMTGRAISELLDPNSNNNYASREVSILPPSPRASADLSIVMDKLQNAVSGIVYNLVTTVQNHGPAEATGIRSYHYLPPNATLIGMTSTKGTPVRLAIPPRCEVASLAPDEKYTVTITFLAGSITEAFTTSVHGAEIDPDMTDNQNAQTIDKIALPELEIDRQTDGAWYSWLGSGFDLERANSLSGTPWTSVPLSEIEGSNGMYRHFAPFDRMSSFYRVTEGDPLPLPHARVYQESLVRDSVVVPFSDHGRLDLYFDGTMGGIRYLNFNFQNRWVIQNIPVTPLEGVKTEKISFEFPLDVFGLPLPSALWDFSLTSDLLNQMPAANEIQPVVPSVSIRLSGIKHQFLSYWPAEILIGGKAMEVAKTEPGFPNPEQGENECAPAAILNSLQYLNAVFDLNIPDSALTLDQMKLASGWTPDGAPSGNHGEPSWVDLKRRHMESNGLPIKTELTTNIRTAMEALRNFHAVEVWYWGHAACVREITQMDPGEYVVTLSDDTAQGVEGGTGLRKLIYHANSNTIRGRPVFGFVIQSPKP